MDKFDQLRRIQQSAKELNEAGYQFIRIKAGEKRPQGSKWTTTPSKSTELTQPGDQIGLLLGPLSNGLVAVDIDVDVVDQENKKAFLKRCLEQCSSILPPTQMMDSRPSREGMHFFYKIKDWEKIKWPSSLLPGINSNIRNEMESGNIPFFFGKQNFHKINGLGIDFLGASAQIVVPPSRHHSGEYREWILGALKEPLLISFDELYSSILTLCRTWRLKAKDKRLDDYREQIKSTGSQSHDLDETERIRRAKSWLTKAKPAISGNNGDMTTFNICGIISGGFDLSEEATLIALEEWHQRCSEPWTETELRRKIREAKSTYKNIGDKLQNDQPEKLKAAPTPKTIDSDKKVYLSPKQHLVAKQVYAQWLKVTQKWNVYQWLGKLVRVMKCNQKHDHYISRPEEAHDLVTLDKSIIILMLAESCDFITSKKSKDKHFSEQLVPPPHFYGDTILGRKKWSEVENLIAVTDYPVVLKCGTVINNPGVTNGILVRHHVPGLIIPSLPDREQAKEAFRDLKHVFIDFPIKSELDFSVTIAAMLTFIIRPMINGPTPMFLINANTRGSGKTLLMKVIHLIITGMDAPLMSFSKDDEEVRKKITTSLMNGDSCICFDNIKGVLGGESLDKLITASVWQDRVLGSNEQVKCLIRTVLFATSNNAQVLGDTSRRLLSINLESKLVNPEKRTEFTIKNIENHIRENRVSLLSSVITILVSYLKNKSKADEAIGELEPLGSFEEWSSVVQGAVIWAGGLDPVISNKSIQDSAMDEVDEVTIVIKGILALNESISIQRKHEKGYTSEELIKYKSESSEWNEALETLFEDKTPTKRSLGVKLGYLKNRRVRVEHNGQENVYYLHIVIGIKNKRLFSVMIES